MLPNLRQCPVCARELIVRRLECRQCGTAVEGQFSAGPFAALNAEQLAFVETFVLCEGKFTRMEGELGLSYPTLRARLHEVLRALGHEPGGEEPAGPAVPPSERRAILDRIDKGELSPAQAVRLLKGEEE